MLCEPRNALMKQYAATLRKNGVTLHATPSGVAAIAKEARAKGVGARGLRSILEKSLLDGMFHVRGLCRMPGAGHPACRLCQHGNWMASERAALPRLRPSSKCPACGRLGPLPCRASLPACLHACCLLEL